MQSFAKRNREQYLKNQYFNVITDFCWAVFLKPDSEVQHEYSSLLTHVLGHLIGMRHVSIISPALRYNISWNWNMIKFIRTFLGCRRLCTTVKPTVQHKKLYPSCHFPAYWLLISEAVINNIEYILFYVLSLYWTLLLFAILNVSVKIWTCRKCINSFQECQSMTHIPRKQISEKTQHN
jgi:hypothetical protein